MDAPMDDEVNVGGVHLVTVDLDEVNAAVIAARREGRWSLVVDPSARYDAEMQYRDCSARIVDVKKMQVERRSERKTVAMHRAELREHFRAAIVGPRPELTARPIGGTLYFRIANASLSLWPLVDEASFPRSTFDFEHFMRPSVLRKLVGDGDPVCADFQPKLSELFPPSLEAGLQPGPPEMQVIAWTSLGEDVYEAALRPLYPHLMAMQHIVVRQVDGVDPLVVGEAGGGAEEIEWRERDERDMMSPLHSWGMPSDVEDSPPHSAAGSWQEEYP